MRTSKELEGQDTHRDTAAEVFSMHPEAVTTDQRRSAKAINFGMLYGMPITEVQDMVDIMKTLETKKTKKTKELSTLQSEQLNEGEQAMTTEQMINFHMNWGGSSGSSVMKTLETKKTKELIIKRML